MDETDNKQSPTGLIERIGETLTGISKLFGVLLAIAYVLGFVVVNAGGNFSSLDDIGLFSVRYVAAGFLLLLFLVVIVWLPGLALIKLRDRLQKRTERFAEQGHAGIWRFILWMDGVLEILFLTVLATMILASVAGLDVPFVLYFMAVGVYFLIDFTFNCTGLDFKLPRLYAIVVIVFQASSIGLFFKVAFIGQGQTVFIFVGVI